MKGNKAYSILALIIAIFFVSYTATGQIVCADVEIVSDPGERADFVFDSFNKYLSGITYHGIASVNVKVTDQLPPNPNCKWALSMTVENNPSGGTLPDEWETLTTYGTGTSSPPKIELLDVRVTNACSTSPIDGVYQKFNSTGDIIEIIENTGILIIAGSCTTNVNGPGTYQKFYDEYHFQIDFRIKPEFNFDPGIYQLQVKFELVEVP
jgi:hypothetical protein